MTAGALDQNNKGETASSECPARISYELREVAETAEPLFDLDEKGERHFLYRPEIKMKEGIYSVTFSFSPENPCGSLVTDILYRIARKDLTKIQGYRIFRLFSDSALYQFRCCDVSVHLRIFSR